MQGKVSLTSTVPLKTKDDLSTAYTPGVGAVCAAIAKNKELANTLTSKGRSVAVISNGTAVLGLGDIGPEAALPVMEGKAIIFKQFAGIDAWPIVLNAKTADEIVSAIKAIAPGFGAINLEDIAAPICFDVEERLQDLNMPVMHDDQHGTAIVALAAVINAAKLTKKKFSDLTIVINGAGAAGIAIARMFANADKIPGAEAVKNVIMCDSKGIVHSGRTDLNGRKSIMLAYTNKTNIAGSLVDAVKDADVFIGVSVAGALTPEMIKTMAPDAIVLAMANPVPEIMPDIAKKAGAAIVATGRSDLANQINNALAFPGIFKGAMQAKATRITPSMKLAAAQAIAKLEKPKPDHLLPTIFNKKLVPTVAAAVARAWKKEKHS